MGSTQDEHFFKTSFNIDFNLPPVQNVAEYFLSLLQDHISNGKKLWIVSKPYINELLSKTLPN